MIGDMTSKDSAARIFNDYLLAHVLFAFNRTGLLQDLENKGIPAVSSGDNSHSATLGCCLSILEDADLVCLETEKWKLTDAGKETARYIGFFVWGIGGYSSYLLSLSESLIDSHSIPTRNDAFVALGSGMVDIALLQSQVDAIFDEMKPSLIADLGCGDGTRLIHFLQRNATARGIGVEKSHAASLIAQNNITQQGLTERMEVLNADCLKPLQGNSVRLADVDCACSFFLLHDLLAKSGGRFIDVANAIVGNFPNVKKVLFADTTIDDWRSYRQTPPIFARGFQLTHAMMGIRTRTLREYGECFEGGPLSLEKTIKLNIPNSYLFIFDRR